MHELVVIGGGEHGRVVLEAAMSRPDLFTVRGFLDPSSCEETRRRLEVTHLGGDSEGLALAASGRDDLLFVLGAGAVGVSERRRQIVERYRQAGARWAVVVHARASVSPTARLGAGTVVMAGVAVNSGAEVGEHCVLNTGAVVEHDVRLGPFVQVCPAAAIGGGAEVGEGSYLGLGCRIRDHLVVGERATVGMGAAVVKPVPAGATVVGVPAAPLQREPRHA
jgi:acetyltransferase EpsM